MISSCPGQASPSNKKTMLYKAMKLMIIPTLITAISACSGQKTDLEYLESAKKYAAQGDYKSHVIELKNALQQNPQNADARYLLALAYLSEQQGAAAQKELERAIEYGMPSSELTDELALAYYYQYKFDDLLLNTIDHQSLSAEDQAKVLFYRGMANISLNRSSDAEADFDASNKLGKTAYGNLSQAYQLAFNNDFSQAHALVTELITKDSKFAEAQILASKISAGNKDIEAAIKYLQNAIELEPNRLQLYVDIAKFQAAAKKYDDAEKNIDIVLRNAKSHLPSNLLKASLRMQAKDWEGAKKHAEQALTVSEINTQAKLISGMSNFYLNNWELTRERLRSVVPTLPADHIARRMLAYAEFKLGYSQNADDILASLGDLSEKDNQLLSGFGTELARKGKYDEAVTMLEKASALTPDNSDTLTRLGILKLQQEDVTGIENLQHALEQDAGAIWARVALAKQYVKQGDSEKALQIANELIATEPNKPEGYLLAAEIYGATGNLANAEAILKKGLDGNKSETNLYFSLFKVKIAQKDFVSAENYNNEILKIEPINERALLNLYRLNKQSGNTEPSLLMIANAVKENPDRDSLKLLNGLVLFDSGQDESAIDQLTKIQKDSVAFAKAQNLMTTALSRKGQYDKALPYAVQWAEAAPEQYQPYQTLADIQLKLNDRKSALATIQQGLVVLPANKELMLREVQLLLLSEKDEQARAKIAKYTASHGQSAELEYIRGYNAAAKGNYKDALLHYQSLHQLKPSSQSVIVIAELYGKLGQKDKAIGELKKWLETHKNDQPVGLYLANINLSGDKSQAISQYQTLVASNPNNVVALNNLAWALGEQGSVTDALKYAEQAYTLSPKVAPVIDTYGYLLLLSGHIPEALAKLQVAHDMQPNEPSISYHYALALKESGDVEQAKQILTALGSLDFPEKEKATALLKAL